MLGGKTAVVPRVVLDRSANLAHLAATTGGEGSIEVEGQALRRWRDHGAHGEGKRIEEVGKNKEKTT